MCKEVGERGYGEWSALGLLKVEAIVVRKVMIDFVNIIDAAPRCGGIAGIIIGVDWYFQVVEIAVLSGVYVSFNGLKNAPACFCIEDPFDCFRTDVISLFGVVDLTTGEVLLTKADGVAFGFAKGAFGTS